MIPILAPVSSVVVVSLTETTVVTLFLFDELINGLIELFKFFLDVKHLERAGKGFYFDHRLISSIRQKLGSNIDMVA